MNRYYYTFGSADYFPFQNGWIIIEAKTFAQADDVFKKHFPCRHDNVLNCSFSYDEQRWREMNPEENWRGWKCYGLLKE